MVVMRGQWAGAPRVMRIVPLTRKRCQLAFELPLEQLVLEVSR